MKLFFLTCISILAFSCSSSDKKVYEIDTSLDQKGAVDGKRIGLNDDGEAIIQEEIDADDELRQQQWANNRVYENLENDHHDLNRCRTDLSDPRLSGSGEVQRIPEIDSMKSIDSIKEDFGLNEGGELKVVRKEYYLDRLKKERKYEVSLRKTQKIVKRHLAECERKMGYARAKQGLPSRRYTAKGYFDQTGTWIQVRKAELTLDDAFEIKAKDQIKSTAM